MHTFNSLSRNHSHEGHSHNHGGRHSHNHEGGHSHNHGGRHSHNHGGRHSRNRGGGHSHGHKSDTPNAFRNTVAFNCSLSALQFFIGFLFGSLALMGDAIHNMGDVAGLLLGWGAEVLSERPPTENFTYGLRRTTQLASLANGVMIFGGAAVIVLEAVYRLGEPVELTSIPVAIASAIGMVVNLISAGLFGNSHENDLNRRAAVIHLLGDAAVSLVVLLSTLIVALTGWDWLDPIAAIVVGLFVAWSGWKVLTESIINLLDGVPYNMDFNDMESRLLNITGIESVHNLRIWDIGSSEIALTVHLVRDIDVMKLEFDDDNSLVNYITQLLGEEGISHITLQLELEPCELAES